MRETKIFLLVLFCGVLGFGCATPSQPNVSILYQIPALKSQLPPLPAGKSQSAQQHPLPAEVESLFQRLYSLDARLALEVGKLPEFQGKIDGGQILALKRFTDLIASGTPAEKANLAELMKEGLPDSRRYCATLQAIFWLLEKNEYKPGESPLGYSLEDLLYKAWNFSEKHRWGNYEIVTDRLNSPKLVNYYQRRRFIYSLRGEDRKPGGPTYDPYILFKFNEGHCRDVTAFTIYCLKKGGYKAEEYRVVPAIGGGDYHAATVFEMDGQKYIMDNGRPDKLIRQDFIPLNEYRPHEYRRGLRAPICQSCAMPMEKPEDFGTNIDGGQRKEYCSFCFRNGKFTDPLITMEEMIRKATVYIAVKMRVPENQTREMTQTVIPKLKRWKVN